MGLLKSKAEKEAIKKKKAAEKAKKEAAKKAAAGPKASAAAKPKAKPRIGARQALEVVRSRLNARQPKDRVAENNKVIDQLIADAGL